MSKSKPRREKRIYPTEYSINAPPPKRPCETCSAYSTEYSTSIHVISTTACSGIRIRWCKIEVRLHGVTLPASLPRPGALSPDHRLPLARGNACQLVHFFKIRLYGELLHYVWTRTRSSVLGVLYRGVDEQSYRRKEILFSLHPPGKERTVAHFNFPNPCYQMEATTGPGRE